MDEPHQSTLTQVTMPARGCGVSPPTLFRERFPSDSSSRVLCAAGSFTVCSISGSFFLAYFPSVVESRGARNKHWEAVEPTNLMDFLMGKVQSQPCPMEHRLQC